MSMPAAAHGAHSERSAHDAHREKGAPSEARSRAALSSGLAARPVPWALTLAALFAIAFCTRLWFLVHGGGLLSVGGYDDGVYYAAADALVHGRLPYRDFLFLHPPGVILALAPFAWLGSVTTDPVGLAAARIAFMAAGAISTVLVAVILRRFGYAAAVFGSVLYGIGFIAVYAERSTLLGPWATVCVLAALAIPSRSRLRADGRWMLLAGVALGLACAIKVWYIVPLAVIVLYYRRQWLRLAVGATAAIVAVCLPFFLADPARMWQQVIADQLGRPRDGGSLLYRIRFLLGGQSLPDQALRAGASITGLTVLLLLLALAAIVVTVRVRAARIYVCLLLANAAVLIASPSFYVHYGIFTMPMLALVAGVALGELVGTIRRRGLRAACTAMAVAGLVLLNAHSLLHNPAGKAVPDQLRQAATQVDGCVVSDDPTVLAAMDVLSRDLTAGCPLWPDVTGWMLDAYRSPIPPAEDPAWQRAMAGYFTSGQAVIVVRPETELNPATLAEVTAGPVLAQHGPWALHATP